MRAMKLIIPFYKLFGRPGRHRRIFPIAKRFWRYAACAGCLVILSAACDFAFPLLSMYIIDNIIPVKRYGRLNLICFGMIFILLSRWLSNFLSSFLISVFRDRTLLLIQRELISHIKRLPLNYFHRHQSGYIASQVMNGVWSLEPLFADSIFNFARLVFILAVGILFISSLNGKMVVIACLSIALVFVVSGLFKTKLRALNAEEQRKTNEAFARLTESLAAYYTEKIFVREKFEALRVFGKLKEMTKYRHKVSFVSTLVRTLNNLVIAAMSLFFLWYGGIQVIEGNLSLGEYVAINSLLASINAAAAALLSISVVFHRTAGLLPNIYQILEMEPESRLLPDVQLTTSKISGEILFEEVYFSYDEVKPVLKGISFEAKGGQIIGIVGRSGAGKTTLVNLIPRLYRANAGTIKIDGIEIDRFRLDDLRRQITIVPQEVFLFGGTIMDNIRYGKPDVTLEELMHAAELAGIHSFIMGLPDNYHTIVRENGRNFSSGQRQRLAIARAILCDPRILVLDEATSGVDLKTETEILSGLEAFMRRRTTIIVSHRPSVIEHVDRVFILADGRLMELDRKDLLLQARNNSYMAGPGLSAGTGMSG